MGCSEEEPADPLQTGQGSVVQENGRRKGHPLLVLCSCNPGVKYGTYSGGTEHAFVGLDQMNALHACNEKRSLGVLVEAAMRVVSAGGLTLSSTAVRLKIALALGPTFASTEPLRKVL